MVKVLVTGGAGFIGSHLAQGAGGSGTPRARARQPRGRAPREPVRGRGRRRTRRGRLLRSRDRGSRDPRDGSRLPRGGGAQRGALRRGSRLRAPQQRHRDPHHAGGGARRRRPALRVRGLVVGVRRRGRPPQARGHDAAPAVAVRGGQAERRAIRADLLLALRHGDADPAVLQRLRPAAGPGLALQRGDQPVRHRDAGGSEARDVRRRQAEPRLHVHRERDRRQPARAHREGARGTGGERRHQPAHHA